MSSTMPGAGRGRDTRVELGGQRGIHVEEKVVVNRPIEEVYRFWRDFTNLPRVMKHLRAVEPIDERRSRWIADGPAGTRLEWDAEIINDVPDQVIGWRSLEHADVVSAGSVNFDVASGPEAMPGHEKTLVTVKLQYAPRAGRAGAWVSWLLGADPAQQIQEDLERLKLQLERPGGVGAGASTIDDELDADLESEREGDFETSSGDLRQRRGSGSQQREREYVVRTRTPRQRRLQTAGRSALAVGLVAGGACAIWAATRMRQRESFRDRIVLITGGGRGLGLELARLFAAEGAYVAICGRDMRALLDARQELRDLNTAAEVDAFACDITDRGQAEHAIDRLIARWGRIDVLVNNAGTILSGPMERMQLEDYERAMAVHFWGPLYLMRAAAPHMRRQGDGRIVNIASIGGKVAVPHLLPYCASKFALVGLSDGMRAELARQHISVTTVSPGLMRTGSHLNARFKGRHGMEYAWFAAADSTPLTSMNSETAARLILEATRSRRSSITLSRQAQLLNALNTFAPAAVTTAMAMVNRLLPRSGGNDADVEKPGFEVRPRWMPTLVTALADRAAERNNEMPKRDPVH